MMLPESVHGQKSTVHLSHKPSSKIILTKGISLIGLDAKIIHVEVSCSAGLPQEIIVGLPDTIVRESKNRIQSALIHSGFQYPPKKYIINLSPAGIKKEGSYLDLPIAVGILEATAQITPNSEAIYIGELSLTGNVLPVKGMIAICQALKQGGFKGPIFYPNGNQAEVQMIQGIQDVPIDCIEDIDRYYKGNYQRPIVIQSPQIPRQTALDMSDVRGQELAKRALEIAAAGRHHILLVGAPGIGKSMLCQRLGSIMSPLSSDEMIECMMVQSIAQGGSVSLATGSFERPFRQPHHTISYAGLVGGGKNPLPGEISLAHNGILFLDEFPEFEKRAIDALRQPLENQCICINRSQISVEYPAKLLLIAAMNPTRDRYGASHFDAQDLKQTQKRLSGPILDRIDIKIELSIPKNDDLLSQTGSGESSATIQKRVIAAEEFAFKRNGSLIHNRDMPHSSLQSQVNLSRSAHQLLKTALEKNMISARGIHSTMKVARTIADLDFSDPVTDIHIAEALQYKTGFQMI